MQKITCGQSTLIVAFPCLGVPKSQNVLFVTLNLLMQSISCAFSHAEKHAHAAATTCVIFSLLNLMTAPQVSAKYLSYCESSPLKPLIPFSTVRLSKRFNQQIQDSMCCKHFTSHCTPSPRGGPISTSLRWLHSPLAPTPQMTH